MSLKFRIRGTEEIKLILPRLWLIFFGSIYIISGIILICIEAYLMSEGVKFLWSSIGPFRGYRIGFGVVMLFTGILVMTLLKEPPKRLKIVGATILAITTLVLSSILCDNGFSRSGMFFITMFGDKYNNDRLQKILQISASEAITGNFYFPFYPWTPLSILMNVFPFWTLMASVGTIFLTVYLLFSAQIYHNDNSTGSKKTTVHMFVIGTVMMVCALVLNVGMQLLASVYNFGYSHYIYDLNGSMIFSVIALMLCGLASWSSACQESQARRLLLFILSFVTLAGCIFAVILLSEVVQRMERGKSDYNYCAKENE